MRTWALVALTAALLWPAAGCTHAGHQDAEAIDRQINAMPGVDKGRIDHFSSGIAGNEFYYSVSLSNDVNPEMAAAVGRTFVSQLKRKGVSGHLVRFDLSYSRDSTASFRVTTAEPDRYLSPDDVGNSIADWLRRLSAPGVASSRIDVQAQESGPTLHRRVDVALRRKVSDTQAVALGRTFTDQVHDHHPNSHDDALTLHYPAAGKLAPPIGGRGYRDTGDSAAEFTFGPSDGKPDPSTDDVVDGIGVWLQAVHSPVAEQVWLTRPPSADAGDPAIHIVLTPDATEATVTELQRSDPGLVDGSWTIRLPGAHPTGHDHDYTATPNPPSDSDRALWSQISDIVGPYPALTGVTRPPHGSDQADTVITIEVDPSADSAANVERITTGIPPLLPGFGHPTALLLRTPDGPIEIVAGGCYRHQPDHQRLPLELELSQQYEHC